MLEQLKRRAPSCSMLTARPHRLIVFFCACVASTGNALRIQESANDDDVHAPGLRPHHNTGQADEDPLVFQHRFQHHDHATGELLYYEYEARRHAHVVRTHLRCAENPVLFSPLAETTDARLNIGARQVMLSDIGATSCAASVLDANHTIFTLTVPGENSSVIKLGSIIAGGELVCRAFEGEVPTSQVEVREKVLAEPIKRTTESGEVEISLVTAPAALHECFEYSQLELFRGQSHQLHTSRNARLASAAANGHPPVKDTFASTDQILGEAGAASSPGPIESLPLQSDGRVEQSRAAATRNLGHAAPYDEQAVSARSGGVTIWGVECSPCVDTCVPSGDWGGALHRSCSS
mgnify:CR=1 FL=1